MATGSLRSRRADRQRRLFLVLHDRYERRFARAVVTFFADQGRRIVERIVGTDVAAALDWDHESDLFIRTVARPQLLASATTGAMVALYVLNAGKSFPPTTKAADDPEIEGELPEPMRSIIRHTVEETLRQKYWRKVQDDTRDVIQDAIDNAFDNQFIDEGRLSKVIATATDGEIARSRAKKIARTETTGAMNSGHSAAIDQLQREGAKIGKKWLAILDSDTRETHEELNGRRANRRTGMFDVGGVEAPYPGYFGLPPDERINCRCTIIGSGVDPRGED
jgi:Phage Mu protein F like protein